jgi:hypothetical protein
MKPVAATRAIGLELGGARAGRSALASLDLFPDSNRMILSELDAEIGTTEEDSDSALRHRIEQITTEFAGDYLVGIHAPTSLPHGFLNPHEIQKSRHPEILWLKRMSAKLRPNDRPFLPYLSRPCEIWLRHITPEKFPIPDALGANCAPIAARFRALEGSFTKAPVEIYPRATLSRLVSSLGLQKTFFRDAWDLEKGVDKREQFLREFLKKVPQLFVYEHDLEILAVRVSAFHAFLSALNVCLIQKGYSEKPPVGFPKDSTWIPLPRADIPWKTLLTD